MTAATPVNRADTLRELPHNAEAEQVVLGALLNHNNTALRIHEIVDAGDFFELAHQRIYAVLLREVLEGRLANPVTLKHHFDQDQTLSEVGGAKYLARLAGAGITVYNVEHYARVVHDLAVRRRLIDAGEEAIARALDMAADDTPADAIEALEKKLMEIVGSGRVASSLKPVALSTDAALAAIEEARHGSGIVGVSTGMQQLDRMLGGLKPGQMVVVGARPGMGKSALGLVLALNAARAGHGAFYASLEMTTDELLQRAFTSSAYRYSDTASLTYAIASRGRINREQARQLAAAAETVKALPLWIEDSPGLTVAGIRSRARRVAAALAGQGRRLELVVVDHMGLIRDTGRWRDSMVARTGEISNAMKALSKELGVAVLVLVQLNREVEHRGDRRPQLSDLRWSGDIEQDADAVLFLYRPAYYLASAKPERDGTSATDELIDQWHAEMARVRHDLEIVVAKQRQGPTGTLKLWCEMPANVIVDDAEALARAEIEAMVF